ncbi:hypothetical protein EON68_02935, partial [archaeon]
MRVAWTRPRACSCSLPPAAASRCAWMRSHPSPKCVRSVRRRACACARIVSSSIHARPHVHTRTRAPPAHPAASALGPTDAEAKHRHSVYKEIFDTEKRYVQDLQVLVNDFIFPLRAYVWP